MQAGSATAGTSTQAPGDGAAHDNLSQHQGRLQAAARAASLYEKSFVYPPANTFLQSPAYQFPPVMSTPQTDASSGGINELTGETAASGHFQQHQPLFPSGFPYIFIPSAPSSNNAHSEGSAGNSDLQTSILKAQESLIQHQIEFLKTHLQIIQEQKSDQSKVTPEVPDCKGKAVAISTPDCVSNCGPHGGAEGSSTD